MDQRDIEERLREMRATGKLQWLEYDFLRRKYKGEDVTEYEAHIENLRIDLRCLGGYGYWNTREYRILRMVLYGEVGIKQKTSANVNIARPNRQMYQASKDADRTRLPDSIVIETDEGGVLYDPKKLRGFRGRITQTRLAQVMQVSRRRIIHYERGDDDRSGMKFCKWKTWQKIQEIYCRGTATLLSVDGNIDDETQRDSRSRKVRDDVRDTSRPWRHGRRAVPKDYDTVAEDLLAAKMRKMIKSGIITGIR